MTNTDKTLSEIFKKTFPYHGFKDSAENEFHSQLLISFIEKIITIREDEIIEMIEGMESEDKPIGGSYVEGVERGFNQALKDIKSKLSNK